MQVNSEWLARELRLDSPSQQEIQALSKSFDVEFIAAGMPIIHQGTSPMTLYLVHAGSVRIVHKNKARTVTMDFKKSPRTFGEMSFFGDEPASADVFAELPCEVYKISCMHFHQLMQTHPKLAMKLMAYVLRSMGDNIRDMDCG